MDIAALARNVRRSLSLCPTWHDRAEYLSSLYSHRLPPSLRRREGRWITFDFGGTTGRLRLAVRDNGGADLFVIDEILTQRSYDVPLSTPPATILDLGANAGYATLFFARRHNAASLACVEPEPDNIRLLRMNLDANDVRASVFGAAVAVAGGRVTLAISDRDFGHRIADIPFGRQSGAARVEVDALSVPELLAQLGWERIGLLKIDIEGYEGILLRERADWLAQVDAICIECHEGFSVDDLTTAGTRWGFGPARRERGTLVLERT